MKIETNIPFGLAVKVWWHLTWRFIVFGLLASMLVGRVFGFVCGLLHLPPPMLISVTLGLVVSLLTCSWVVKNVLVKEYRIGGYRLALVKEEGDVQ